MSTTTTTTVNMELDDTDFINTYVTPLVEKYGISRNGTKDHSGPISVSDISNIKQCMTEIPKLIRHRAKRESLQGIGSYGGKHVIEAYRRYSNSKPNGYISNGEFMVSMLLCGFYPSKWIDSINQSFTGVVYKCKELPEFDYEEFKTNALSKFRYTDDRTKELYLSAIDYEYPRYLCQHYKNFFIAKLTEDVKKEFIKNGLRRLKSKWAGVEWTGKFLPNSHFF